MTCLLVYLGMDTRFGKCSREGGSRRHTEGGVEGVRVVSGADKCGSSAHYIFWCVTLSFCFVVLYIVYFMSVLIKLINESLLYMGLSFIYLFFFFW